MTSDRDAKDCVTRLVCCVFFVCNCLDTRLQIGSETKIQRSMLYQGRDFACILDEVYTKKIREDGG